jgi:hypothetical protein
MGAGLIASARSAILPAANPTGEDGMASSAVPDQLTAYQVRSSRAPD